MDGGRKSETDAVFIWRFPAVGERAHAAVTGAVLHRASPLADAPRPMERTMTDPRELEEKFWKALESDRTMMLGLDGQEDGHARPMTAQAEDRRAPIWFFTSQDNMLARQLGTGSGRAIASFASKGHDLFASVRGTLRVDTDRAVVERLWNPFVGAWFEGKDDPRLRLLRLDAEDAEVWIDASSMLAGVKMLLGMDPKKEYRDKVGDVDLR